MLMTLDETNEIPKSTQILEQVRHHIQNGALRVGERLPSMRHLASQLGVHRSTVATAYQELWSLGWIELRAGASPQVRARTMLAVASKQKDSHSFDWGRTASPCSGALLKVQKDLETRSAMRAASVSCPWTWIAACCPWIPCGAV